VDSRDTLLSVLVPPNVGAEPFVEIALRSLSGSAQVGRRGQLHFATELVFKAADAYRQDQSAFRVWADVRVIGQDGAWSPNLGKAAILDPILRAIARPLTWPAR
jgi:hypothetical protein